MSCKKLGSFTSKLLFWLQNNCNDLDKGNILAFLGFTFAGLFMSLNIYWLDTVLIIIIQKLQESPPSPDKEEGQEGRERSCHANAGKMKVHGGEDLSLLLISNIADLPNYYWAHSRHLTDICWMLKRCHWDLRSAFKRPWEIQWRLSQRKRAITSMNDYTRESWSKAFCIKGAENSKD